MAITTYVKLPNELLTAAEAATAADNFEAGGGIPTGYAFRNWSSSSSSNVPVTELEPGGSGVRITSNRSYYPVVGLEAFIDMTKSGSNLNYVVNSTDNVNALQRFGAPSDDNSYTLIDSGYITSPRSIQLIFAQSDVPWSPSGTSGSVAFDASAGNVDFGLITLETNSSGSPEWYAAYQSVSDVDGETYQVKIHAHYESNLSSTYIDFVLYRLEDGNPVLIPTSGTSAYARYVTDLS